MIGNIESVLEIVRQLPPDQRQELIRQLNEEVSADSESAEQQTRMKAHALVDELFGSLKGLDKETIIQLAEDEEYCGY